VSVPRLEFEEKIGNAVCVGIEEVFAFFRVGVSWFSHVTHGGSIISDPASVGGFEPELNGDVLKMLNGANEIGTDGLDH
jgi:hypothetical protein